VFARLRKPPLDTLHHGSVTCSARWHRLLAALAMAPTRTTVVHRKAESCLGFALARQGIEEIRADVQLLSKQYRSRDGFGLHGGFGSR
jgi:hypothetical protein